MKRSKYIVFFKPECRGNLLCNTASKSILKVDDGSVSAIPEKVKSTSMIVTNGYCPDDVGGVATFDVIIANPDRLIKDSPRRIVR